jgi:hypothetical protein
MYRRTFVCVLIITAVLAGAGLIVCKKTARAAEEGSEKTKKTKSEHAESAPEGCMIVEEDIWIDFIDEPSEKFHKARQSFLQKDYKEAADEIRKGAAFLRFEAGRATESGKKMLMESVDELEKLAKDVEQGVVTSDKALDHTFARAHHALAMHHHAKSAEYQAKNQHSKAGHALKAAATHLEHGFAWAGHKLESATVAVIKDTGLIAGKLIEGTGWVSKEVGEIIEKLGVEIQKLGRLVEPKKPEQQIETGMEY